MNLLFETLKSITEVKGKLYWFQQEPEVTPEPLMIADTEADGVRVNAGTVLRDGGIYRMWYNSFPIPDDELGGMYVAHAVSENGIDWKKAPLDILPDAIVAKNNYVDLPVTPSIFIDPDAPAEMRYRAVGYLCRVAKGRSNPQGTFSSMYGACSSDGLHWRLESETPLWHTGDTSTVIYHPGRKQAMGMIKYARRVNGICRRTVWSAETANGRWGETSCAMIPDEFDDTLALAKGHVSSDYYKMSLMAAAGESAVGFMENFRHDLPYSKSPENYALYGISDISLTYQHKPGDRWLHAPGRREFVGPSAAWWTKGWISATVTPVEVGDEHWLYLSGSKYDHAWDRDTDWKSDSSLMAHRYREKKDWVIGAARWPKWRLFGYRAAPSGSIEIELGEFTNPSRLFLNYKTETGGSLKIRLFIRKNRSDKGILPGFSGDEDAAIMDGDRLAGVAHWRGGEIIPSAPDGRIVMSISMDRASFYAWEMRPAN